MIYNKIYLKIEIKYENSFILVLLEATINFKRI